MARVLPTNTALRLVVGPLLTGSATVPASVTVTSLTVHAWAEAADGGAPVLKIDSVLPTATGGSNDMLYLVPGVFDLEVTAAQLNWLGRGRFQIAQGAVYLPYVEDWLVVPAHVYNGLVANTDKLNVYATSVADPAGVTTGNAKVDSLTAYANPAISSIYGGMATAAALTLVDDFVDTEVAAILANVNSVTAYVNPGISSIKGDTAAALARTNSLVAYVSPSVSSIYEGMATAAALTIVDDFLDTEVSSILGGVVAIKAKTDILPSSPAGVGDAVILTAAALSSVNAEADAALVDIHLDHLLAADYDPATKPGVATALLNELVESDGGVSRYTANALEQAPSGTGASAAAISSAVWQEALASHPDAGTAGKALTDAGTAGDPWSTALPGAYGAGTAGLIIGTNLTTPISSVSTDVPAVLARVNSLVAHVSPGISSIYNALDVEIASIKGDTAAVLARANSLVAHVSPGISSIYASTNSLKGYVSPAVSSIYGGMATAAALTVVDDFLDTEISSLLGYATAIRAKTDIIPASPAPLGGAMTLATGAITAAVIAQNAIDADALAADVATELQAGLATAAALSSVTAYVNPSVSSIYAGMATAAALTAVDDFLDTEVSSLLAYSAAIKAKTDIVPSSPAALGDAMALTAAAVDAVLDDPVEGAYTLRQAMRLVLAASAGKLSGAGTSSITIRDINDTTNRITAAVDGDGNRSVVTKDVT